MPVQTADVMLDPVVTEMFDVACALESVPRSGSAACGVSCAARSPEYSRIQISRQ